MLIYDDTFVTAMTATQDEATALGARTYGSEHVLLGLLASDDDTDTATAADAARFAGLLAARLGLDPALVLPAHEDIHYYLWKEKRLPANVVAEDAKLRDPLERALVQLRGELD